MKSFKSDYFYIFQICTRLLWPMPTGKVERGMKQLSLICILGKIHLKESSLYLLVWKSALNLSKTSNSQSVVWGLYYTYHCKWKLKFLLTCKWYRQVIFVFFNTVIFILLFTFLDINYLKTVLPENIEGEFFDYLQNLTTDEVRLIAIDEGMVVFPKVPLISIEGPLPVVQLMETPLLNLVNYAR